MLENLSNRLNKVWRYLKGEVKITEENMQQALREIRLSLLEADVNFKVVKGFIEAIREKAQGQEVHESLNPSQQVIKIVFNELVRLLGSEKKELATAPQKPTIIMLTGLQGSGKTTTAGKLALHLEGQGKSVLLASLDIKRLAAVDQLRVLAGEVGAAFAPVEDSTPVPALAVNALKHCREYGYDTLIADTAGRLHIDEELMAELAQVRDILRPTETIFVADSMTGQDAVNSAQRFAEKIGIDSIILTKLDADSRGGAALSIVSVTGKPIKFMGVGEKLADFQKFYPERLAQKILGMGDVLTLIEKAEQEFDQKETEKAAKRILDNEFTLDDFAWQLQQVAKMGSISDVMGMMPNLGIPGNLQNASLDDRKLIHTLAIIRSMTPRERNNPKIIDGRRRLRISRGCGRSVQEVNQLLKNFQEMKNYMKKPFFRKMMRKFDIFGKMM